MHGDRSPTAIEKCQFGGQSSMRSNSDQDWGEVRLDAITKYMESIQQK
jgi:hypothetical protein